LPWRIGVFYRIDHSGEHTDHVTASTETSGRPYYGALFAVIVWGASFIATKIALHDVQPMTVVWLRFGIGVLVLSIAVPLRREFFVPSLADLRSFALLGVLGITVHQWLQVEGLVTSLASTTGWIITAIPLVTAIVARIVLDDPLHRNHVIGILIGAAGVLLVVSRGDWHRLTDGAFGAPGDLLIGISTITWSLFSVYSRKALHRHNAAPMTLYVMGSGWLFSTVIWIMKGGPADLVKLTAGGWIAIVFLGVLCSGLAYIYWYDALKALPVAQVTSLLYVEPLVTMFVAAAMLGEPITLAALMGGAVILLGVKVATLRRSQE
jgi:drug/metabolite transporter (DMT)-like permease